jgi:hypothetical protein
VRIEILLIVRLKAEATRLSGWCGFRLWPEGCRRALPAFAFLRASRFGEAGSCQPVHFRNNLRPSGQMQTVIAPGHALSPAGRLNIDLA